MHTEKLTTFWTVYVSWVTGRNNCGFGMTRVQPQFLHM